TAELDQSRIQDRRRTPPRRTVRVVDGENRVRVQRVVDIEIRLQPDATTEIDDLAQPQIELRTTIFEQRLRCYQRHGRCGRTHGRAAARGEVSAERWGYLGIRGRVVRGNGNPGNVLERPARDESPRQAIASEEFDLRLSTERCHDVAVQQFLRRVHGEAAVGDRPPRIHATTHLKVRGETSVDAHVDEI